MNSKTGKNQQSFPRWDAALEGPMAFASGTKSTWLPDTLGPDVNIRRSQERAMAAEVFLQTCLFPLAEEGSQPDETRLVDLLATFKRARRDLDNGFEMAHVTARLLNRLQCYMLDDPDPTQPLALESDSLQRELALFTSLAELDFQRIDTAVRKRLHSG
jgi:hypothetical protein